MVEQTEEVVIPQTEEIVMESPTTEIAVEGKITSMSDEDMQFFLANNRLPNESDKIVEQKVEEPTKQEEPIPPTATQEENFIIPKSKFKGILNDGEGEDAIISRLTQQTGSQGKVEISEQDKKAQQLYEKISKRNDILGVVNHLLNPNHNLKHYVDVMALKVDGLDNLNAIIELRKIKTGHDPELLKDAAMGDYMLLSDDDYLHLSEASLRSLKAAASIKLEEDGKQAKYELLKMQSEAEAPPQNVEQANAKQKFLEDRANSEQAWKKVISDLNSNQKISQELTFKDTSGLELKVPFTFDLNKPEIKEKLKTYSEEFINTVISYDPSFVPTEKTMQEARTAALNRYELENREQIRNQIAADIYAHVDLQYAKKNASPRQTNTVIDNGRGPEKRGMVGMSDEEVNQYFQNR